MSSSKLIAEELSDIFHPRPRRPFELDTPLPESSTPPTPSREASDPSRLLGAKDENDSFTSRTRSVLNLTSSTLFGIYAPAPGGEEASLPPSPALNGLLTPSRRVSLRTSPRNSIVDSETPLLGPNPRPKPRRPSSGQHHPIKSLIMPLCLRTMLLFSFGVAYGIIISHLHDAPQITPVQVQGIERWSWPYLIGWGSVGVLLGGLLPWMDFVWEDVLRSDKNLPRRMKSQTNVSTSSDKDERPPTRSLSDHSGLGADWNPIVRSMGAFIGIAFAIRKLPWQSTLQVSLTLALVNPVLWYLVDRSKPGFMLSILVGITGTVVAFGVNPDIVPSPATPSPRATFNFPTGESGIKHIALISNESIGVGTWIASVLFCSSVCFGNIGRRLALGLPRKRSDVR